MVAEVMNGHGSSQRCACRLIGITRRSLRRVPITTSNYATPAEERRREGSRCSICNCGAKGSQLITTPINYITSISLTCDWSSMRKATSASDKTNDSGIRHSPHT